LLRNCIVSGYFNLSHPVELYIQRLTMNSFMVYRILPFFTDPE